MIRGLRHRESSAEELPRTKSDYRPKLPAYRKETASDFKELFYEIECFVLNKNSELKASLEAQKEEITAYKRSTQDYFWLLSSGVDLEKATLTRYLPVKIYIPDPIPSPKTLKALVESIEYLLNEKGLDKSDEFPEEVGSWWKKLVVATKKLSTLVEVKGLITEIKNIFDSITEPWNYNHQAKNVANILKHLDGVDDAIIQIGPLLLIKITNKRKSSIITRMLTRNEIQHIEENQTILKNPKKVLHLLNNKNNLK